MMKPLVIYHANCTDGWTAAWVAARSLSDVDLHPGVYGQPPPNVTGRDVYVLDFSYKRDVMASLINHARTLVVLDHHVTAQQDLAGLELLGDDEDHVVVVFDLDRSGAALAWDYLNASPRPWLVDYVQDRDLWRWQLEGSRLVSAGLEAWPKTLEAWDEVARLTPATLAKEGAVIERYRQRCLETIVDLARPMRISGHQVLAANSSEPRLASDGAARLAAGHPFGATWWVRQDGVVQWSLRAEPAGVDVSQVAQGFGGGGHPHAAGFQSTVQFLADRLAGR